MLALFSREHNRRERETNKEEDYYLAQCIKKLSNVEMLLLCQCAISSEKHLYYHNITISFSEYLHKDDEANKYKRSFW